MLANKSQSKTLLASQPIYTAQKNLFGFELLFRHELFSSANEYGEDLATSEVLLNLCTGITEHIDLLSKKIFINLSESLLLSDAFLPVPPESVVIELPASVEISEPLINGLKKWKNAGFCFALDDFDFNSRYQPILDYIQYLKVDALNNSIDNVASKMPQLSKDSITWIAKRVETGAQFIKFKDLGFSLFQGYFLAEPLIVHGQAARGKINNSIAVLNAVSQPEIEVNEMAQIVSQDPSLAIQLLKIVNSPACSLMRPINSVRDAIVYLGLIQVRKWIIMMSLLNETANSIGARHLILTRAKACENYAAITHFVKSDQAFLVGLLSGVSLLFGIDNVLFLQQLSLQPAITNAILKEEGILGQILSDIIKIEYTILQDSSAWFHQGGDAFAAYYEASNWAEKVLASASDI